MSREFEKVDLDNLVSVLTALEDGDRLLNDKDHEVLRVVSQKIANNLVDCKPPKLTTSLNILEEANNIIFNRGEEKERQYGPIDESLEDTAIVASIISNTDINIDMVYAVLVALKMSRLRHNKKHDTFLDGIGYLAAFENYLNKKHEQ